MIIDCDIVKWSYIYKYIVFIDRRLSNFILMPCTAKDSIELIYFIHLSIMFLMFLKLQVFIFAELLLFFRNIVKCNWYLKYKGKCCLVFFWYTWITFQPFRPRHHQNQNKVPFYLYFLLITDNHFSLN